MGKNVFWGKMSQGKMSWGKSKVNKLYFYKKSTIDNCVRHENCSNFCMTQKLGSNCTFVKVTITNVSQIV